MGPDFELFWSMCNYVSEKCSLDLKISREPEVTIRIRKCIGNGASAFVYEASLLDNLEGADATQPLYTKLKAAGKVSVKVF